MRDSRRYFVVKHDLRSFRALPGFIWRTEKIRTKIPRMFGQVKPGDRWIEFAYVRDGDDKEPCSLVNGFYECTHGAEFGTIPREARTRHWVRGWESHAWTIRGRAIGPQLKFGAVSIPPLESLLGRALVRQATIVELKNKHEFDLIRDEAKKREFDPREIPILGREPENEQEVVAILAGAYQALGIRKILKVQTRFPDALVQIGRREIHIELEFDSIGFWDHLDDLRPIHGLRRKRLAKLKDRDDQRPVTVLCWVDGDKKHELEERVRNLRIFELQTLLRERRVIRL